MRQRSGPRRHRTNPLRRGLLHRSRVSGRRREDELGYVFVVTYGRSGSTLLQGILNTIPGYLVRGENRQVLRHLWRYELDARDERAFQRRHGLRRGKLSTRPSDPYYGIDRYPVDAGRTAARRLAIDTILRPEPDTRVTGFKEIRWEDDDVTAYVAWLREVFPGARFVVNTRDLDDVARSKWWADQPDAREHLARVEARLLELLHDLGTAAYRVHYDDYVADPDSLAPLFAWLGETWDPEAVRRTLARPHSY